MSERILDQFDEFDDPPPIERDGTPSARKIRRGKEWAKEKLGFGQKATHTIGAMQRQSASVRKKLPKITLATKA